MATQVFADEELERLRGSRRTAVSLFLGWA